MNATRAVEGWVITANAAGGLLVAAYLIGLSDVGPGESVARVWIGVLSSSLSLSAVAAVLTVIGQPVNEAARLTDAAKVHPGRVLTSAVDHDGWLPAGTVELRGIGTVTVFSPP